MLTTTRFYDINLSAQHTSVSVILLTLFLFQYHSLPLLGKVSVETEPIFMTNTFGNAFVNPNDVLNTNLPDIDTHLIANGYAQIEQVDSCSPGRKYRTKVS